ncbi:MAG: AsmA family protein [Gammaproteobacteria bacterium]|jgi:uncharacterized protein involved in outer membrane biogenesis
MHYVKVSLLALLAVTMLMTVAVVVYIASLDNEDYKALLIKKVETSTNLKLSINGQINFDFSLHPTVNVSKARLTNRENSLNADIKHFTLQVGLLSLFGTLPIVKNIQISDAEIYFTKSTRSDSISSADSTDENRWVFPIIENAELKNIFVKYVDENNHPLLRSTLQNVTLKQKTAYNQLVLEGQGLINDKEIEIQGQLGSPATSEYPAGPYPVFINLNSTNYSIEAQGTIGNIKRGSDFDIVLRANIEETGALLKPFLGYDLNLGKFDAYAEISGDFPNIAANDLNIRLSNPDVLMVDITGTINDLTKPQTHKIKATGQLWNTTPFQQWIPNDFPTLENIEFSSMVALSSRQLELTDISITANNHKKLQAELNGKTNILYSHFEQPFRDMTLDITAFSPTTRQLEYFLIKGVPELGAVNFKATMTSPSDKFLALSDLKGDVSGNGIALTFKGQIGRIPLNEQPNTEIDVDFELQAESTSKISKALDTQTPELGPLTLTGNFSGSKLNSTITNIRFTNSKDQDTKINVTGTMAFGDFHAKHPVESADLHVLLNASDIKKILPSTAKEFPSLGPVRLEAKLGGAADILSINDLDATIGDGDELKLEISGEIERLPVFNPIAYTGLSFHTDFILNKPIKGLSDRLDVLIASLKQGKAKFDIKGDSNDLAVLDINVNLGKPDGPHIIAKGNVPKLSYQPRIAIVESDLSVDIDIPSMLGLSPILDRKIPDLGPLKASGNLKGESGRIGIQQLELQIGKSDAFLLQARGSVTEFTENAEANVTSRLSIPDVKVFAKKWGIDYINIKSLSAEGLLKAAKKKGTFSGEITVNNTVINSDFSASIASTRPEITGIVSIPVLHLADFGLTPKAAPEIKQVELEKSDEKSSDTGKRYLFSRRAINTSRLRDFDFTFTLDINEIVGATKGFDSVKMGVKVENGSLILQPAQVKFENGAMNIFLKVEHGEPAQYAYKVQGQDIDFGKILNQIGVPYIKEGKATLDIDLKSHGQTPHEIASNLNGPFGIVAENARVLRRHLELLAVDLVGWALASTTSRSAYTNIHCVIVRGNIADGIVNTDSIYADSVGLTSGGHATIDLKNETIDMVLLPKSKQKIWSSTTPVKITGPLVDPTVTAVPYETIAKEYTTYLLLPQVYIPAQVLGYMYRSLAKGDKERHSPCLQNDSKSSK